MTKLPGIAEDNDKENKVNSNSKQIKKAKMSGSAHHEEKIDTVEKLQPAGLTRGREGLPVIPGYTKVGETFRKNVPHEMQCSMFCGGKKCKYEIGAPAWRDDQMALQGVYSHWVTDDLLAMARPNMTLIKKGKLIDQFKANQIKSIVNLQTQGEHASCGQKLEASGFSYEPKEFMDQDISCYNFPWKDYGEASMSGLLDMVKVLSFALSQGKVAVHCHAGLGRTGVLMACYLVYYMRVRSNDAIRFVRMKRPGAVQTRKQIDCVKEFEAFFLPQCLIYSSKGPGDPDRKNGRFSVESHLKRQKSVIHGFEARALKYLPKIMFTLCERMLRLSGAGPIYEVEGGNFTQAFIAFKFDNKGSKLFATFGGSGESARSTNASTPSYSMAATRRSSQTLLFSTDDEGYTGQNTPATRPSSETTSFWSGRVSGSEGIDSRNLGLILGDGIISQSLQENGVTKEMGLQKEAYDVAQNEVLPKYSSEQLYRALLDTHGNHLLKDGGLQAKGQIKTYQDYRRDLNFKMSAWDRLHTETNLFVLTALLLEWMEHLKHPILGREGITYVVIHCDNIESALKKLPNHVCYILEYVVRFVARLQPLQRPQSEDLMRRFMASLTHQTITIGETIYPAKKKFTKLRGGTGDSILKFMMKLYDMLLASPDFGGASAEPGPPSSVMMYRLHNIAGAEGRVHPGGSSDISLNASTTSSIVNNHSMASSGAASAVGLRSRHNSDGRVASAVMAEQSGSAHHSRLPSNKGSVSSMEIDMVPSNNGSTITSNGLGRSRDSLRTMAPTGSSVILRGSSGGPSPGKFRSINSMMLDTGNDSGSDQEDSPVPALASTEPETDEDLDRVIHEEYQNSYKYVATTHRPQHQSVNAIIHTVPIVRASNNGPVRTVPDDAFEFDDDLAGDDALERLQAELNST